MKRYIKRNLPRLNYGYFYEKKSSLTIEYGTSKNYKCGFNRDTGWDGLGIYNLKPVRQVAIDNDWSAIRFRRVGFIKTITRAASGAITDEARKRTSQKGGSC